jgi:hypothetical protein
MSTDDQNIAGFATMLTQMSMSQINDFSQKLASKFRFPEDFEVSRDINGSVELPSDIVRDALHSWALAELADRRRASDPDAIPF